MNEIILDVDNDILKMLSYDTIAEALILKVEGDNPAVYVVSPVEKLDMALKYPHDPSHVDMLLDARNYIYKENSGGISNLPQ